MSSFYRRINLDYRPKELFKSNQHTKQYLYNKTSSTGSGTSIDDLIYYFEYDYADIISSSSDFAAAHTSSITSLGVDVTNIRFTFTDGLIHTKVRAYINPELSSSSTEYATTKTLLSRLETFINNGSFTVSFTDDHGNTAVANPKTTLESDGYHYHIYRYNTLYTFAADSDLQFQLLDAVDSTETFVQNGDKVYVLDSDGKYLHAKLDYENKYYTSSTFEFKTSKDGPYENDDEQRFWTKILFEVHAYSDSAMSTSHTDNHIQDDYGFKLELLPPYIQSVFNGLSTFIDDYSFENDGTYVIDDDVLGNFNVSAFYNQEIYDFTSGSSGTADLNDPADSTQSTYNIDQVWLTWDTTANTYGFSYDESEATARLFFNGSRVTS